VSAFASPPPGLPGASRSGGAPLEPPRRRGMTLRFLLAALGIILLSGGATAAIALNEVGRLVEALQQHKPIKVAPGVLAPTSNGAPQTLLLVGNDERAQTQYYLHQVEPHSNEMLLVRIDPSQPTISMLSIPRELKVPIDKPDGEVEENRINSAFTYGWENGGGTVGGVQLMVKTIEQTLGLEINHVFVTNFHKFEKAVNAMGCVYMTVDKRYEHTNEPGGEQYFEIHLKPGYQKLCGTQALEFVANRHESTSLIRDARDQRFLLQTKTEYGPSLFENREKFERIFGKYVESTLENEEQILQLLYLLIESVGKPVRQVEFHVTLGVNFNNVNVDTATPEQIHEAVTSFLEGTASITNQHLHVPAHSAQIPHSQSTSLGFALTPTTSTELEEARAQALNLPFPLEYPRARDSYAEAEPDELRLYQIHDQQGRAYPIYTIVISRGVLGQFYDVQGTTWTHPPLLSKPEQTVHLGSRTYELFYAGEHLSTIAWREHGAVYWIENTLTNNVSPQAMLAVAEQTVPVAPSGRQPVVPARTLPPRNVDLAPRPTATSTFSKIGTILGFAGVVVVAVLAMFLFVRQRQIKLLRDQIADALVLEARQRPLLASAGLGAGSLASDTPPVEAALTIHRARRLRRPVVFAIAAVALIAVALALAFTLLETNLIIDHHTDSPPVSHHARTP
jgi:polyisoprenyl-teichoic acid--peptidoglycan teichoic acid transferase